MALDNVANFVKVTVSIGYDASAVSIVLSSGDGAKLPDPSGDNYNVVWFDSTNFPDPSDDPNVEIVRVTAISTDTLTVTRNQEGSGASTKNTGGATYKMILAPTAKMITDIETDLAAKSTADKTETLTNKTFDANGTGNSLSNVDVADLANGTDGELITWDAAAAPTTVAAGTATHVLTSNGAGAAPTFQAAGGGGIATEMIVGFDYENSARYASGASGSGASTFDTAGVIIDTGTTSGSHVELTGGFLPLTTTNPYEGDPQFSQSVVINVFSTSGEAYFGTGNPGATGTGITMTHQHIGFKMIDVAGTVTLYATQADGTTESATSLTTLSVGAQDAVDLIAKIDSSGTSVDYYWRKNGGALSSATTISTNFPTSNASAANWVVAVSNASTADDVEMRIGSFTYRR